MTTIAAVIPAERLIKGKAKATISTQYCLAEIPLFDDLVFYVDGNSKVTAGNGLYEKPAPNAFSLPHISTCPGSTPECRESCYVHGLANNVPEQYARYAFNAMALNRVLYNDITTSGLFGRSVKILSDWIYNNCQGGFRWHVSGDVMNKKHAHWIREVSEAAEVLCWIYTRTFDAVSILKIAKNLVVNISADSYNYKQARQVALNEGVRLTYLVRGDGKIPDDLPPDSVIFPDYSLRGRELDNPTEAPWWKSLTHEQQCMVCPADFFSQSEHHRCGPCQKCLRHA